MNIEEVINRKKDQVIELAKAHFGESFIKDVYLAHKKLEPLDLYCVQMSIHPEKELDEEALVNFFIAIHAPKIKSVRKIVRFEVDFCDPEDSSNDIEIFNNKKLSEAFEAVMVLSGNYELIEFSIIEDCGPTFEIILDAIKANDKFKHICDNFYCFRLGFIQGLFPEQNQAFLYFKTSKELYTLEFCKEFEEFIINVISQLSKLQMNALWESVGSKNIKIFIDDLLYKPNDPAFEEFLSYQKHKFIKNLKPDFHEELSKTLNEIIGATH